VVVTIVSKRKECRKHGNQSLAVMCRLRKKGWRDLIKVHDFTVRKGIVTNIGRSAAQGGITILHGDEGKYAL